MANRIFVANKSQLQANQPIVVEIERESILLYHVDDHYWAVNGVCTHQKFPLAKGYLLNDEIICPLHGARFDLRTGECLRKPAMKNLKTYPVLMIDNAIYIEWHDD